MQPTAKKEEIDCDADSKKTEMKMRSIITQSIRPAACRNIKSMAAEW
jgi:hypothetical protein